MPRDGGADDEDFDSDAEAPSEKSVRRGPSLKARAVSFLSRREHSRAELARKLQRHCDDADQIAAVLDSLQQEGWLSDERYAQSMVRRRGGSHGTARVVQELRRGGVDDGLIRGVRAELQGSEYQRALSVWQKRYAGKPATTAAERAKQARFLAARGFSGEVISKIVRGIDPDE